MACRPHRSGRRGLPGVVTAAWLHCERRWRNNAGHAAQFTSSAVVPVRECAGGGFGTVSLGLRSTIPSDSNAPNFIALRAARVCYRTCHRRAVVFCVSGATAARSPRHLSYVTQHLPRRGSCLVRSGLDRRIRSHPKKVAIPSASLRACSLLRLRQRLRCYRFLHACRPPRSSCVATARVHVLLARRLHLLQALAALAT